MTDLNTKLEEAGEGARELDWLVADATGHPSFARKIEGMWPPFCERSRADKDVPAYSTSIDAALALASRELGEAVALTVLEDTIKAWSETAGLSIKALPAKLCANVLRLQITES